MNNNKDLEQIYKLIEGLYTHTTAQFTELRAEVAGIKDEIADLRTLVAKNGEAIERLEHEVKKVNKTLLSHDLDIQLLKKAVI